MGQAIELNWAHLATHKRGILTLFVGLGIRTETTFFNGVLQRELNNVGVQQAGGGPEHCRPVRRHRDQKADIVAASEKSKHLTALTHGLIQP
jgi:hypothetical protein